CEQVADDRMDGEGTRADQQAYVERAELDERNECGSAADENRAEIGDQVGDAGDDAPDGGLLEADGHEGEPGQDADENADCELHEQVALDLIRDLVQRLDRDPLLAEARPGQLDHLAAKGVAGGEQKEGDEEDDGTLAEKGERAERSRPQIVLDVEAGLLD